MKITDCWVSVFVILGKKVTLSCFKLKSFMAVMKSVSAFIVFFSALSSLTLFIPVALVHLTFSFSCTSTWFRCSTFSLHFLTWSKRLESNRNNSSNLEPWLSNRGPPWYVGVVMAYKNICLNYQPINYTKSVLKMRFMYWPAEVRQKSVAAIYFNLVARWGEGRWKLGWLQLSG